MESEKHQIVAPPAPSLLSSFSNLKPEIALCYSDEQQALVQVLQQVQTSGRGVEGRSYLPTSAIN
jgi:cytochrome c551/c552